MASLSWAESYIGQLRALAGDRTLLFVGARGVIRDDAGRVLLVKRADNGAWVLPAGAMEVGESITDCAVREIYEETGLTAERLTPFAIYSNPSAYTLTNMYGDTYQLFIVAFRIDAWSGQLLTQTDETTDARFFAVDEVPVSPTSITQETLNDLATFERTGTLIMK